MKKKQELYFQKYQGTGNDFVMIDDRKETFNIKNHKLIAQLCDRRFGIGADGLILLRNHKKHDFKMVYFNADGFQSSMCGNGGRCIVKFAQSLGIFKKKTTFLAIDGIHKATVKKGIVSLKMSDVNEVEKGKNYFYLDTGSPHYVCFSESVSSLDLIKKAQKIRYNKRFKKEGTNVNFVAHQQGKTFEIRTYERGVEDETLSCGTGVTAAAISANQQGFESPIQLKTQGGILEVSFQKKGNLYQNIFLIGKAEFVFEGIFNID